MANLKGRANINMDIWSDERLRIIGDSMNEQAEDLVVGTFIKMGIAEDPCRMYRSGTDQFGQVVSIERNANGMVEFTARMSDGSVRHLTNYSILPGETWEVIEDPQYRGVESEGGSGDQVCKAQVDALNHDVDSIKEQLADAKGELSKLKAAVNTYRGSKDDLCETWNDTLAMLCDDVNRLYRGKPPEFAPEYSRQFQLKKAALIEEDRGEEDMGQYQKEKIEFRGVLKKPKEDDTMNQHQHQKFPPPSLSHAEVLG